jgi:hypothetical protein
VFSFSPWIVRLAFEVLSVLVLSRIEESLCLCRISHIELWYFCHKYNLGRPMCFSLVVALFGLWFSSGVLHSRHCLLGLILSIWFPLLLCVSAPPNRLLGWYSDYLRFCVGPLCLVLGVGSCWRRRGARGSWPTMRQVNKGAEGVGRCKDVKTGWEDCSWTV